MINSVYVAECSGCEGTGMVFFGDNNDYSIEPCECVAND